MQYKLDHQELCNINALLYNACGTWQCCHVIKPPLHLSSPLLWWWLSNCGAAGSYLAQETRSKTGTLDCSISLLQLWPFLSHICIGLFLHIQTINSRHAQYANKQNHFVIILISGCNMRHNFSRNANFCIYSHQNIKKCWRCDLCWGRFQTSTFPQSWKIWFVGQSISAAPQWLI